MVTIEFTTDNAAFHEATIDSFGAEVARILRKIADEVELVQFFNDYPISDINGNKIGAVTITEV